ncbi:MAG: LPS biosynthesis protein [Proteobacteria bacterium]|nr:MAG: LPS biosynthesis protein [Pseudomonadota bacterium]
MPPKPQPKGNTITDNPHTDAVYLEADGGVIRRKGISELEGAVIIQRNHHTLNADKAQYDSRNTQVKASGNVILSSADTHFKSDRIDYNLTKHQGTIHNASYQVNGSDTHGKSQLIQQKNADKLTLHNATYTTCPAPDPSWHIASRRLTLDNNTQTGHAEHVTFRAGDIPLFYLPWFSFSLNNQRKSGFLSPKVGMSDQSGYEITLPYYFNIAPNYDATVSLTRLSKRGWEINSQFRFMNKQGQGIVDYRALPDDGKYNDKWRDYFNVGYEHRLSQNSKITFNAEGVSDDDYFNDLGNSLVSTTTSALERQIRFTKNSENWAFSLSALDYQVLDADYQPYAKLPEAKFSYQSPHKYNQTNVSLAAEATYFESSADPTGLRIDVGLKASRRFGNDAWYVKPGAEYRLTQYNLENNQGDNTLSRAVPTFTLDSRLFFERTLKNGFTQTLEPRLFYAYTPYKDQSDYPVFDTAEIDFSTANQLFSSNRFTGKDRIGDTNQLTLALTSRIQNPKSGHELLELNAGQVFYFEDRDVTLPGKSALTGKNSEIVLGLSSHLNDQIHFSTTWLWDPDKNDWSSKEARINYQDEKQRTLNLSYQHLDGEVSEVDSSFSLPFNQRWSMVGRVDYDLFNDRSLELLAGFEYRDCCWGSRLVARRYLTSDNTTYDDALYFELELKGLGRIGNSARSILQEKTYGYELPSYE